MCLEFVGTETHSHVMISKGTPLKTSVFEHTQILLTLGAHAQRGLRYLVCVSVCVSVTQHLTFYVFIHATNDTNLLGGG